MNPQVKEKWVSALLSNDYKQGRGQLRMRDFSRPVADDAESPALQYCCLGVLCELHASETGTEWGGTHAYLGERTVLPQEVVEWAGLRDHNPTLYEHTDADGQPLSCAAANDSGVDFVTIAHLIDRADL